ncbi:MAG: hypothetical protein H6858_07785 [Rhodospirillales bacterium]|nr:hypothetical protein [Alphaproteobacteria bacterium]MCB9977481.1 hypothetical protein [Rhodospirillales bacterium]
MSPEKDNLCSCYWPEKILLLPDSPAILDEITGEFRWKNSDDEGYIVFKFCPKCGYEIPKISRDCIDGIPKEEYIELQSTLKNIRSIKEMTKTYGKPDKEVIQMNYLKKSETVTIHIFKDCDEKIEILLRPKSADQKRKK